MAGDTVTSIHQEKLEMLMHTNHHIRELLEINLSEFLSIREELFVKSDIKQLLAFNDVLSPWIEQTRIDKLRACIIPNRAQLVLCGENSSGKTAFLHTLLGIGKILPSSDGPVTGRITKLTYASAEQAHISIRRSFQDQDLLEPDISLAQFFSTEKPNWKGIGDTLSKYVKRPKDYVVTSSEFAEWARGFVEVYIPSAMLALGVDVYDTPGFLLDDAPILKEILHDLVAQIHPTIVFMYANPSTDDATRGSFLGMKTALHDLGASNIFFLNSKADIAQMPRFKKDMKVDDFLSVLADERAKRYHLLLRAPLLANDKLEGLPELVEQCQCFDLCSVNSQVIKPYGPLMNSKTIERIMQFVTKSDLAVTKYVCRLVLPIIDAFFELLRMTRYSTMEQLLQLHSDATNWSTICFKAYAQYTKKALEDLFSNIFQQFQTQEESIVELCVNRYQNLEHLESSLQETVRLQIIKPAFRETVKKFIGYVLEHITANTDLTRGAVYNEILIGALGRQEMSDVAALLLGDHACEKSVSGSILYIVNTFSVPIIQCAHSIHDLDLQGEAAQWALIEELSEVFKIQNKSSESRINEYVRENLLNMQTIIGKQRNKMEEAVRIWGDQQQAVLRSLIDAHYNKASPAVTIHQKILEHLEQYAFRLTIIECRLRAAHDMAKFNDRKPEIRGEYSVSSMFSVFTADWGDEKNLLVKKIGTLQRSQPDGAYFEAHYHLRTTNLRHSSIVDMRYLYEHRLDNQDSELWIIFPPILITLDQFLKQSSVGISMKQILKWMINIADALTALHRIGLVHRSVALSSIVLTEENDAMLIDLGIWDGQRDLAVYHDPSSTYNETNDDMTAFGDVGQILSSFIELDENLLAIANEFKELIFLCTQASREKPIAAEFAAQKLCFILDMIPS